MAVQILVTDDGGALARALSHLMTREGFAVRLALDADAALSAASDQRPDLVVLDAAIKGRDGYEVCRRMRADPKLSGIKIVMLSARCGENDSEKAAALGADALVSKPVSCHALAHRLCDMMSGAHV
jgi:DNA-binding response OmpR family regulator